MVNAVWTKQSNLQAYDEPLLWTVMILLGISLVMVFSASIAFADANAELGHNSHYFLFRQSIFIVLSLIAGVVVFSIPTVMLQKWAPVLFLIGIFLLILVIVPGVGRNVKGSVRWLPLGIINFQPSEIVKLLVTIYVADYTVRKTALMNDIQRGFLPMLVVMILVGTLLLLEPDLGAFVVITGISMSILWLGGMNIGIFIATIVLLAFAFYLLIFSASYRSSRIDVFLQGPWADPYGAGYQLTHSLMALGRGDWFGVGLGASIEKLHYLPDAHTDFLLAVIGEELGFVGVLVILGLFAFIVLRAFKIAKESIRQDMYFSALLAQGLGVWFGIQSFINIGVNMGLLPTKGLTLPLLSFGGTGIITNCMGMAILLRIDFENRQQYRGVKA